MKVVHAVGLNHVTAKDFFPSGGGHRFNHCLCWLQAGVEKMLSTDTRPANWQNWGNWCDVGSGGKQGDEITTGMESSAALLPGDLLLQNLLCMDLETQLSLSSNRKHERGCPFQMGSRNFFH